MMLLAGRIATSRVFERFFIETDSQEKLSAYCKRAYIPPPAYTVVCSSPRMYICRVRINSRHYDSRTGVQFETENLARECAAAVALNSLMGDGARYSAAV